MSDRGPLNWKILIAVLFAVGVPVAIAVRVFWIHHNWGAFGVGITVGYAVVLAMMWSGRAPQERKAPAPAVMTQDAWIYFRMIGSSGFLTIVNTGDAPLRVPGLADGVAGGVTVEALQSGESKTTVSLSPRTPPPGPILEIPPTRYDFVSAGFEPESTPSGRTIQFDAANALGELPPGRYDLRVRWDPTALAGEGLWTPPTAVILGIFPYTKR